MSTTIDIGQNFKFSCDWLAALLEHNTEIDKGYESETGQVWAMSTTHHNSIVV